MEKIYSSLGVQKNRRPKIAIVNMEIETSLAFLTGRMKKAVSRAAKTRQKVKIFSTFEDSVVDGYCYWTTIL